MNNYNPPEEIQEIGRRLIPSKKNGYEALWQQLHQGEALFVVVNTGLYLAAPHIANQDDFDTIHGEDLRMRWVGPPEWYAVPVDDKVRAKLDNPDPDQLTVKPEPV